MQLTFESQSAYAPSAQEQPAGLGKNYPHDYRSYKSQLPWRSFGDLPFPRRKRGRRGRNHAGEVTRVTGQLGSMRISATAKPAAPSSSPPAPKNWSAMVKSSLGPALVPPRRARPPASPLVAGHDGVAAVSGLRELGELALDLQTHGLPRKKAPLIVPRGLVNTGNMCFMNAILQAMIFCPAAYNLLDTIGSLAIHNLTDSTPLLDAMIMLLREYRVAPSAEATEGRGKIAGEYDEPFVPDVVYDAMHGSQRFRTMQRGHQQDAEEFLGFLLDALHEEICQVIRSFAQKRLGAGAQGPANDGGWLEVGPKQKVANTRSAEVSESVITRLFGGKLRSVVCVPGQKDSIVLEPYLTLQLDIQADNVHAITDALRNIPMPETLGEFRSSRSGELTTATKQMYVESMPDILVLHLKRFVYDSIGGTQKLWKVVGYPLELEIPESAIAPTQRQFVARRYRLRAVVYHHGMSASGGHYTADILRQDDANWINIDDTVIRPISPAEVAVDVAAADAASRRRHETSDRIAYILFYERLSS